MKKFIAALLLAATLQAPRCSAESAKNFCGTTEEMLNAEYWIKRAKDAGAVLLNVDGAARLSAEIRKTPGTYCTDILEYAEMLPREAVLKKMAPFSKRPGSPRFIGSEPAGEDFWRRVEENADAESVEETTIVRFAAAARNAEIKAYPCGEPLYGSAGDLLFDMNAESTVKIWEPLAALHESKDGKYYFVETPGCSGWISKDDVALTDKRTLREIFSGGFYVVTASRAFSDIRSSEPEKGRGEFLMGTRLPAADVDEEDGVSSLFSRCFLVPQRGEDGSLKITTERLPLSAGLSRGFPPCTQANVIRQAFKTLGERYGWGGSFSSRDCSAFVRDLYLTFGVELPRNSSDQARVPGHIDASKMSAAEKEKLLASAPAGTILQMPGHVMLLLGTVKGRPYAIHSVYALGPSGSGGAEGRRTINCVAVTDMEMTRKDGSRVIESIANVVPLNAR